MRGIQLEALAWLQHQPFDGRLSPPVAACGVVLMEEGLRAILFVLVYLAILDGSLWLLV